MKINRLFCLFLILVLCLTSLSGCKGVEEEDFGVVDSIEEGDESTESKEDEVSKDEPKEEDPKNEDPKDDDPKEEDPKNEDPIEDDPKEEDPKDDDPIEETPKEEDPKEETPAEPDEGEEDLPPITKESSGTAVTFMMQNLKTAGNQTGLNPDEREASEKNLYRRKFRFKQMVLNHDPDVILAQECTPGWLKFFETDPYFANTYTIVWTYRKPGSAVEMATPVLYKTNQYKAMSSGHFWYSDTPKIPSPTHGYTEADGETHYRHCSWVQLRDKKTGDAFYAYSVHMDAGNEIVAYKSMSQLLKIFDDLGKDAYAFIGGDFNFGFRDTYYNMAVDFEKQTDLQDMAHNMNADGLCELGGANGSLHSTYDSNTIPDPNPGRKRQLDHIFAKNHPNFAVDYWGFDYTDYEDAANQVKKGFISDHYGLVCKVRINTQVDYSRYQREFEGELAAAES